MNFRFIIALLLSSRPRPTASSRPSTSTPRTARTHSRGRIQRIPPQERTESHNPCRPRRPGEQRQARLFAGIYAGDGVDTDGSPTNTADNADINISTSKYPRLTSGLTIELRALAGNTKSESLSIRARFAQRTALRSTTHPTSTSQTSSSTFPAVLSP